MGFRTTGEKQNVVEYFFFVSLPWQKWKIASVLPSVFVSSCKQPTTRGALGKSLWNITEVRFNPKLYHDSLYTIGEVTVQKVPYLCCMTHFTRPLQQEVCLDTNYYLQWGSSYICGKNDSHTFQNDNGRILVTVSLLRVAQGYLDKKTWWCSKYYYL